MTPPAASRQPPAASRQLIAKGLRRSFTLVELLTTIAIIAVLTITAGFFTVSYINWAQQNSNNRTLMTLNTALQTYKTLGGMAVSHSLQGLNSHAEIVSIYNALQNGFTVGGEKRIFMNKGATLPLSQLYATGSGSNFSFCGFGDNTNPTTLAGTYVAQYVPPPALVGSPASIHSNPSSTTTTLTIPTPTAGDTLVLCAFSQNLATTISAVSGGGVTWTQLQAISNPSGTGYLYIWAGPNSTGVGTTLSITISTAWNWIDFNCSEWSGMPSSLTTDGGSTTTGRASSLATGSITPTAGKSMVIFAAGTNSSSTITAGPTSGFTSLPVTSGIVYAKFAYLIVPSASGSYSTTWTNANSYDYWAAAIQGLDGN